jgi:hypothetical protein
MMSRYQERLFDWVNGPTADKLQRQPTRRAIVVACLAGIAVISIAFASFGERVWLLVTAALPLLVAIAALNFSLRGIFELNDELLDEYQLKVRNEAYKTAYGFTVVFLIIVATTAAGANLERQIGFAVAVFAFFTSVLAPRLLLAWRMGDSNGD